jgi:hypothetical protein
VKFVVDEDLHILDALLVLGEDEVKKSLTILEPGKIRSRKR